MAYCYLCNETLNNRNKSEEHIIPNAVGGKRSSYRLLCKACNERTGKELDIALAQAGAASATQLQIKRDRGSIPEIIATEAIDQSILLRAGAKVILNYYLHKTKDAGSVQGIIEFTRNGGDNDFCRMHLLNLNKEFRDKAYHVLLINGDAEQKILWGYFELFGEVGFVALLDKAYTSASINFNYVLDPVTWDEPLMQLKTEMSRAELMNLFLK